MGKLTVIGEIIIEDELRTGAFIECSREELKKISKLFLEEVEIIQAQQEDSADQICLEADREMVGDDAFFFDGDIGNK